VRVQSTDNALLQGTARVSAVLDQVTPGSTNFVVKAVLPNPAGMFHSGMVVTGVVAKPPTIGLRVPRTAFVDDAQSTVQTIVNGAVKTIPVTMIAEDAKNAVVIGVHRGQTVIVNGQLGLTDGQPVLAVYPNSKAVAER
jgi:hypothetical protein